MRLKKLANGPLACALSCGLICGTLAAGACAHRSDYRLPVESSPAVASGQSHGGAALPPPPPPAKRGVIVPGDPASGTTQLGAGATDLDSHTGTSGTRVTPGSSDGAH